MKRAILPACVLTALLAIPVHAAEPQPEAKPESQPTPPAETDDEAVASEETPTDATEPVIPKRELVFKEESEPFPLRLFSTDPEVLQYRFVVAISFGMGQTWRSVKRPLPDDLARLRVTLQTSSVVPTTLLDASVRRTPKDRLPSPDLVEALTSQSPPCVRYTIFSDHVPRENRTSRDADGRHLQFLVLAPTRERAKELARAVLPLFDYGFSYPIQRHWLLEKRGGLEDLATKRASLSQAEEELRGYEKQLEALAEYEDMTKEALNGLITQQRLISVDLSGVRARIGACTKILAGRDDLRPSQVEQVEQIKITAEIELVGLEARKSSIDHIVEKANQRRKLLSELANARVRVDSAERDVSRSQQRVEECESERQRFMPFPIRGGTASILPLKWLPVPKENP
ncbi:MAG: hypothetical protein HQ582_00205 [Planctomycetes bacterium]|nr:hypothetical protein [Planctomycetota bacterium]